MISFSWPGVEPGDDIQTATHQLQDFPMNMRNSILSFLFIGGIIAATSLTGFGEGEPGGEMSPVVFWNEKFPSEVEYAHQLEVISESR